MWAETSRAKYHQHLFCLDSPSEEFYTVFSSFFVKLSSDKYLLGLNLSACIGDNLTSSASKRREPHWPPTSDVWFCEVRPTHFTTMTDNPTEKIHLRESLTDPRVQTLALISSTAASIVTLLVMFTTWDVVVAFSSVATFLLVVVLLLSGLLQ